MAEEDRQRFFKEMEEYKSKCLDQFKKTDDVSKEFLQKMLDLSNKCVSDDLEQLGGEADDDDAKSSVSGISTLSASDPTSALIERLKNSDKEAKVL